MSNEQPHISKAALSAAFRQLFEAQKNRVFNTALGLVQNREDAEDITQEVFVAAYDAFEQFRGEAQLSTWLYRITVNKSLDFIKAKKAKKRFAFIVSIFGEKGEDKPAVNQGHFEHPGVVLENKENAATLFKAIEQLPEQQKVAFTLAKLENLSYAEIAAIMQTSVSSVESLMFRAKQNLQKTLRDYYQKEFLS